MIKLEDLPRIIEIEDAERANQIAKSGDYNQPRYSDRRNKYIFIRKKQVSKREEIAGKVLEWTLGVSEICIGKEKINELMEIVRG